MDEAIDLARQKRLPFRVNRGQVIDKTISVNNANGTQYDFTGHTAEMYVYNSFNKTDTPEYTITVTLALGSMTFSHAAITRKKENHVYKLWMTDASGYRQIWTNGDFLILDSEVDHEDGEETIVISPDGDDITLTISPTGINHYRGLYVSLAALQSAIPTGNPGDYADVDTGIGSDVQRYIWDDSDDGWVLGSGSGGASEAWELETFTTVLTFDNKKHLTTVEGGTRTFTVAASGNLNGVEIIARIDKPVAVNFPANSEAINGSDEIDSNLMNIIRFIFFQDYDTDGNDKILYEIKNQQTTIVDYYVRPDTTSRYVRPAASGFYVRP